MAYLDLAFGLPQPVRSPPKTTGSSAAAPTHIAPIERSVIAIARSDSRRSIATPGRLAAALCLMFGWSPANRLADPRLEALRRFAVLLRLRGDRLPAEEGARLVRAGFSRETVAEVRALVRDTAVPA